MKKYKSHCCIPWHAAMSIDMLTSWITLSLACLAFFYLALLLMSSLLFSFPRSSTTLKTIV
jgi:hypothetical protein